MHLNTFNTFRHALYACFQRSADVLFEITDALLTETVARSLPELSLSPFFRRLWPSLYQALQEGRLDRPELRCVLANFAPQVPPGCRRILGIDASNIARPESPTAADRTCLHVHNLPASDGAAITYGWQFSTLMVLPDQPGSQTYILDNVRIPSSQTACQVAAAQLEQIVPLLDPTDLLTADRYYGSAIFVKLTAKIRLDKLLRIKCNAVFYRPPPPPTGRRGAPRKDGARFKCNDPTTQGEADESWAGVDGAGQPQYVERWNGLHFRLARETSLSVMRVTRPNASDKQRERRVSWFIFVGRSPLALTEVSPCYRVRYSQEHAYRFDKQALLWATPRLRTPEQFQLWTDLMSIVHNEVVLAEPIVTAQVRPWESKVRRVSLQQVRRGLAGIISELGTPARPPKGRGKSPGRAFGATVTPAKRYKVVRKRPAGHRPAKKRA